MLTTVTGYLLLYALLVAIVSFLEQKKRLKLFSFVPAVIFIYIMSMLFANIGVVELNTAIKESYKLVKTNLLPAMLFLMLLQIDFRAIKSLGRTLIYAYLLALFSLIGAFMLLGVFISLSPTEAAAFGALSGSWMGGSANMIAVGEILGVEAEAYGVMLLVDSINYSFWLVLLLLLVPFSGVFNSFTGAKTLAKSVDGVACSCTLGAKRYWLFVFLAFGVSILVQSIGHFIDLFSTTTTNVLLATLLGVGASFTRLREFNGSSELANTLLYLLIALIGSQAVFENFDNLASTIFYGTAILFFHACVMFVGAKLLRLDLFSISVASLANIGGVASAPILAAAYHKNLVGVGVLMAVVGYLIGTLSGLFVGHFLLWMAQ